MTNISKLYLEYTIQDNISKQLISNIKTALFRYTLPELDFVIPERSKKRFHKNDFKLALEFASQFEVTKNTGNILLEAQEKVLAKTNMSLTNKRQQKMNLNKFIEYIDSQYYNKISKLKKQKKEYTSVRNIVTDLSHVEKSKVKKNNNKKITISLNYKDYSKNENHTKKEIKRIAKELNQYIEFLYTIQGSKDSTENCTVNLKRLLGWQYIKTQSLEKVSLTELIPIVNIYPDESFGNPTDRYINEGEKRLEAKKIAKKVISFVENFFKEYSVKNYGTKCEYIRALINLSKYLYKDITDKEEFRNYEDISVICRLRNLRADLPKDNKKIELPLPTWDIVIKVLIELKNRSNYLSKKDKSKRAKTAIAKDLQRFLMLGFFALVPPSRQRVIRELRIGETLKHGLFKDGAFVPKDKLNEEEKKIAKYYIHLQPEDYKTGDKYGEWLAEFPNTKFDDRTSFYDYLDKWIYGGSREILLKDNNHNYLFVKGRKGEIMDRKDCGSFISTIFLSTIKQSVSPQKLRTIYRTYLADIGADQKTLESSAFWMRHSPEMAKEVYTKQTLDKKLAPGQEMIAKINQELFTKDQ